MTRTAAMRLTLGLAALALAAAAVFAAIDSVARDERLRAVAGSVGAAYELGALRHEMDRMSAAIAPAGAAAWEVAAATAPSFRGRLAAFLADETRRGRLEPVEIEALARLARGFDARLAGFETEAAMGRAASEAPRIAASMTADAALLGDLAAAVRTREVEAAGALSSGLEALSMRSWQMAGAAIALAALLGLALAIRSAPPTALLAENAALNRKLAEAQLARTRFVAMMSHELRTPMNGVLGLLSLMKDAGSADERRRLIDQAERAGRQLTAMLGDMLDVESGAARKDRDAAAEAPAEAEAPATFKLESVAESLNDVFGPVARQYGTSFRAVVKGEIPEQATGDGRRFQRALAHLCTHVVERAGVKDVALELSHDGERCNAALSFEHPAGAAEAKGLAEIASAPPGEGLGGHGLGPLLAKGLLESMGGRLEVSTLDSGRVLILASTPSKRIDDVRPRVRVIAQTRSLGALGAAAASAAGVDVMATEKAPDPDVVLVEAGGVEEERAVAEARMLWPAAVVVSLGRPDRSALFDVVIAPPLDPARVAKAVGDAWSERERVACAGHAPRARAFANRNS